VAEGAEPAFAMRPMRQDEFEIWVTREIEEYADDLVRNRGWTEASALEKSRRDFAELAPRGVETPDQRIEVAVDPDSGERIGLVWFARQQRGPDREVLFLNDLAVEEPYRRRGVARRLMAILEGRARELGLDRIELNVFGDNHGARRLYDSLGYVETSRQMAKELTAPSAPPG
jgi:ribosomal protein S18 acetylase RimI-like enzyme